MAFTHSDSDDESVASSSSSPQYYYVYNYNPGQGSILRRTSSNPSTPSTSPDISGHEQECQPNNSAVFPSTSISFAPLPAIKRRSRRRSMALGVSSRSTIIRNQQARIRHSGSDGHGGNGSGRNSPSRSKTFEDEEALQDLTKFFQKTGKVIWKAVSRKGSKNQIKEQEKDLQQTVEISNNLPPVPEHGRDGSPVNGGPRHPRAASEPSPASHPEARTHQVLHSPASPSPYPSPTHEPEITVLASSTATGPLTPPNPGSMDTPAKQPAPPLPFPRSENEAPEHEREGRMLEPIEAGRAL